MIRKLLTLIILFSFLLYPLSAYAAIPKPYQYNWRCCKDDAATPTTFWANENSTGTLIANTEIVRVRIQVHVTSGGGATFTNIRLEYSTDDANWTALGSANAWNWANGQGTNNDAIADLLLTNSTVKNIYCEVGTNDPVQSGAGYVEYDFAIAPTATIATSTTYYFKITTDGYGGGSADVPLQTGYTHASITTAAGGTPPPVFGSYQVIMIDDN
jgi:hypothetical protein